VLGLQKSNKKISARRQINIKGVQDGILLLPNNKYRIILEASAVNFELKSEAEQDAIIDAYQSFLNSLATPIQIITRVRGMDMRKYVESFEAKQKAEKEPVYREQIENYIEFVQKLTKDNKILTRRFYIVVPYDDKEKVDFQTVKEHLMLNADIVTKGLERLGIQTRQLDSWEILNLFYSFYNPGHAKRQPLTAQTLEMLKEVVI
jgi:type IV secretory pathway VirB4 component